jgi:hypothetical protein
MHLKRVPLHYFSYSFPEIRNHLASKICSGQMISDTGIGGIAAIFRS